jgi:4-aminobutyrate aminotransferase-like enzyme
MISPVAAPVIDDDVAINCRRRSETNDGIEHEDLPANARSVGEYFLRKLIEIKDKYPVIGEVRGRGLMIAVELVKDRKTKEPFSPIDAYPAAVSEECAANGVMIRTIANKFIISPPLTFTREHVDFTVGVLDKAFAKIKFR